MPQAAPIADLADLVAPLSLDDFAALLAARTPLHLPGTPSDAARFAALLDWDGLVEGVREERFPARALRLYRRQVRMPAMFLRDAMSPRAEIVDKLLATDASIVLNAAERHVPALGRLCSAIARDTRDHISAAAFATTGKGSALELHYDEYDIVVLQVDGAKKWSIYADPVTNPVYGMLYQLPADPDAQPAFDIVLHPGDRLYVPAGWRHCCDTQGGRSLHLGILLYPFTAVRAAELILRGMLETPDDRAPLRFGDDDAAATEAALRRRLMERIDAMPLDELVHLHQSTGERPLPARRFADRDG